MKKFNFPHKPYRTTKALSLSLKIPHEELLNLSSCASLQYVVASRKVKKDGTERVTYNARPKLKEILKRIKLTIFDRVEVPYYIFAGRRGKSYTNNAEYHLTSELILAEDIKSFFPSISFDQVRKLYQHFFLFSPDVSKLLAELCTKDGFLVQGSPVSGEIANLIFFNYEPDLVEWCESHKLRYTRYCDDIHVSSIEEEFYYLIPEIKQRIYGMFGAIGVKPHRGAEKSKVINT